MGGAKALQTYKGRPLYSYGLQLLQSQTRWTVLLGRCPELAHLPLPQWWEETPGEGPLGALVRGLRHSPTSWNLMLALDYPDFDMSILPALDRREGAAAILPRAGGQAHPLCGFYHRDALPGLERQFCRGERSVLRALEAVQVRWLDVPPGEALHNVNRPSDLR